MSKHQSAHLRWVLFILCKLYLNGVGLKKIMKAEPKMSLTSLEPREVPLARGLILLCMSASDVTRAFCRRVVRDQDSEFFSADFCACLSSTWKSATVEGLRSVLTCVLCGRKLGLSRSPFENAQKEMPTMDLKEEGQFGLAPAT